MKFLFIIIFSFTASNLFAQADRSSISFKVSGLCAQCKQRIENSLKVKGVHSSSWNAQTQLVDIIYSPALLSEDDLHRLIALSGHDTEKQKADDRTYLALPECCLYRSQEIESPLLVNDSLDQNFLKGIVKENINGVFNPLAGASIHWSGTNKGTITNLHGEFSLEKHPSTNILVISYAGFTTDSVSMGDLNDVEISLSRKQDLTHVVINARSKPTYIDTYDPFRTAVITKKELLKAACCNLAESFETNPSVDVSYNDALTGSKQIQLLGLAGPYTQLTVENLPGPRGLATPLGLNSIAGPWIDNIHLIKGTGSVVNGFESIAGQINVELRKPRNSEKLYLNGYLNSMAKTDINLNWSHQVSDNWWVGLLLHDDFLNTKQDENKDGFLDLPAGNQFSAVHSWQYLGDKGLMSQFGIKLLNDNKTGGEVSFDPSKDKFTTNAYGLGINTRRYEAFAKLGYVFPERMYKSIGLQLSVFDHRQDAYFGLKQYDARQRNFYSNLIYQTQIGSEKHKISTGLSVVMDDYAENLQPDLFARTETVAGLFAEYTYKPIHKLDIVAGIRADHNNIFGWFATPRLNIRYEALPGTTLRLSMGRGQRTANIIAENMGLLASSRSFIIEGSQGKSYGLEPEIAWNKGFSVDQRLKLFGRDASVVIDFYRNDFSSQVVVDLEDINEARFYNLDGPSYSNSLQLEFNASPVQKFDMRLAYRFFDVKTTYRTELKQRPFSARHRAFANLAYDLDGWKMDYTINYVGMKRIPSTGNNPFVYSLPLNSPSYVTMNAQVSKSLGREKNFDIYLGGENLGNMMQERSILAGDDPFGEYFDASMIWGPVSGRLIYAGFRYRLK